MPGRAGCDVCTNCSMRLLTACRLVGRLTTRMTARTVARLIALRGWTNPKFKSSFSRAEYHAVEKCREYIYQGDVYQVVISQRLSLPFEAAPLDLYRALRTLNPSPYMYFIDLGDFHIAGASPENLVRLEQGEVTVRPIAGTRRRGENDEQDAALGGRVAVRPEGVGRTPDVG